jgi:2-methylcitrate dehydratase PrpD
VEIAVLEAGWPLVCEPRQRKYSPSSIVDAQFSMPFAAALALSYRKAGLDQFTEENLKSAQLRSLMSKVVMVKDKQIEKNFPGEWATRVKVQLTSGKEFEQVVRFPKGDPQNPLSWEELTIKFQSLAMRVFPQSRCQEVVDAVSGMNRFTALRTIWKLMSQPTSATPDFRSTAPAARGS